MKIEWSVQKVFKGPGGHHFVGETRKSAAVAAFELLYHKIGAIAYLLGYLIAGTSEHMKCNLQSCFSKSTRLTFIINVSRLLDYILSRQSPYTLTAAIVSLHNVLHSQAAHPAVAKIYFNALSMGRRSTNFTNMIAMSPKREKSAQRF